MAFLPQPFKVPTFATGASLSPAVQLPGAYLYVYLVVPTMNAGYSVASTPLYIQGSADGVNYYRYVNVETNTNTVGANDFQVVSATSQRLVNIPNFAFQYVKVELSCTVTTPASAAPFTILCVSNQ